MAFLLRIHWSLRHSRATAIMVNSSGAVTETYVNMYRNESRMTSTPAMP